MKGDRIPIGFVGGQTVYEGQSVLYEQCIAPECPAHREGFHHGHARIEDDPSNEETEEVIQP